MEILTAPGREGKMRGMTHPEIALVIICQNAWEELHLTLMQCNHENFVELRTYMRDQGRGKASPTVHSLTVNLELWPQFIAAVGTPGNCIKPIPFWGKQRNRDFGRSRLIFPQEVLQKKPQKQIFLEHKNFQGITFISLKTLARSLKGQGLSQITIGPLLWSQFIQGLKKMEEKLIDLGILVGGTVRIEPDLIHL
jgi:hypothetical protein